jgi:hypothetical protein
MKIIFHQHSVFVKLEGWLAYMLFRSIRQYNQNMTFHLDNHASCPFLNPRHHFHMVSGLKKLAQLLFIKRKCFLDKSVFIRKQNLRAILTSHVNLQTSTLKISFMCTPSNTNNRKTYNISKEETHRKTRHLWLYMDSVLFHFFNPALQIF